MTTLAVPDYGLLFVSGAGGAALSAFARDHFTAREIAPRPAMVELVDARLAARQLIVIDQEVTRAERADLLAAARARHAPAVMIAFARSGHAPPRFADERFDVVHTPPALSAVTAVEREALDCDRRGLEGPFDLIGDVHGCAGELEALLARLGYRVSIDGEPGVRRYTVEPPRGRRAVFLGDLTDRGPRSPDVLRLVKGMVEAGSALCVRGNHDDKLARWMAGRRVQVAHGLQQTIDQIDEQPEGRAAFLDVMHPFLEGLADHAVLDGGRLVAAHAGLLEPMHNRRSGAVRSFALYGDTTGNTDAQGRPERRDWAADYRGAAMVVHGHTPMREPRWLNGVACIDTGCVFGGALTALRYPERVFVAVAAERVYRAQPSPFS